MNALRAMMHFLGGASIGRGGTVAANWNSMTTCASKHAAMPGVDRCLFEWQTLIVICCGPPAVR